MKEIRDIVREFASHRDEAHVLATLVRVRGSSYRRRGARMLISENGRRVGSLSGGCLEDEVALLAREVFATGRPALAEFDTRRRFGCHGAIEIFVEPVRADFLDEIAARLRARAEFFICTDFENDLPERGSSILSLGQSAAATAFVQRVEPTWQLTIFGAGPDSAPLRGFAQLLGWEILEVEEATDLREAYDERCAVVVKSHNYRRDFSALQKLLPLDLRYVGLVGPRKRRDQLLGDLLEAGLKMQAELFAPCGIDLGADGPEEIALAIVSEIQNVFAEGSGESLRARKTPIHGWTADRLPLVRPAA